MSNLEPFYLYILSRTGFQNLKLLESYKKQLGSFQAIYKANAQSLCDLGWNDKLVQRWQDSRKELSIKELITQCEKHTIKAISFDDENYPFLLRQLYDAPPVLFYRGTDIGPQEACISIVGTRAISSYGKSIISRITGPIIASGCTIVSGLAYGIDAAVHQETVNRKARTIAVLGSGLDDHSIYPRHHVNLAQQILEHNGTLVSEHPPGTPAFKQHFIARNRIIAGLSLGTIVVECKKKSGALITADYAIDLGRPVYAVPGPIYSPTSEGPHNLIRQGAVIISDGTEVLEDLKLQIHQPAADTVPFTSTQQRVLKCMQSAPATIDTISQATHLNPKEVAEVLTELELTGVIRNLGAQGFITL